VVPVVQDALTGLMGETGVLPEDVQRYRDAGYQTLTGADLDFLDAVVARVEAEHPATGWAQPGSEGSVPSAHLDVARTICRRAELALWEVGGPPDLPARYLNRLADVLWLLARAEAAVS
jgi:cob(I)alamin adenosyltransferase